MPPSGIPQPRQNSGARNGKPRRKKPRCGWAASPPENPWGPCGLHLVGPEPAPEEKELPFDKNPEALESAVAVTSEIQEATKRDASNPLERGKSHRRRGRRGGKNRRKGPAASESAGQPSGRSTRAGERTESAPPVMGAEGPDGSAAERGMQSRAVPILPAEPLGEPGPSPKGRYGDPGLSSRISLLEMQFRRLLACPPAKLNEADLAPVGPGVFVLTDSDLTTYYYVEVCQTLRIANFHVTSPFHSCRSHSDRALRSHPQSLPC